MSTESGESRNRGQFEPGRSGNSKGRPRGGRRKLNDAFIADWLEAWMQHGKRIFQDVAVNHAEVFFYGTSSLITSEVRSSIQHMIDTDAKLAARMFAARAELQSLPRAASKMSEPAAPAKSETNRLAAYRPYRPQADFHEAGAIHDERMFLAGNQLGKTLAGGMEWAMHLTGRYPDWWKGKVFNEPVRMWAAGVTVESTRDNPQRILIGPPQQKDKWGSGTIPKDALKEWRGVYSLGDALDSVVVRWGGGGDVGMGESVLCFKSYEKGREKWQGETLDGVWFDEEPPLDIYSEGRTRCVARRGIVLVTMTPLQGMTELLKLFLSEADLQKLRNGAA